MIYELAAMPQATTEAFVKALYVILLSAMKDDGASTESIAGLKKWGMQAQPLIARFKLVTFPKVYKEVIKGKKFEDEEMLKQLGKEIKQNYESIHKEHDIKAG